MYIALNPQKSRRFVTKGVNLNLQNPVGIIPPDLEDEFMIRVNEALASKEIFEIDNIDEAGLQLPGLGSTTKVTEKTETKIGFKTAIFKGEDGKPFRVLQFMEETPEPEESLIIIAKE